MNITFYTKVFETLTCTELYEFLQLRSEIFVVEQNCPYQDLDNVDLYCTHVMGYYENKLIAYGRIVPPKVKYSDASLGRIVVKKEYRKHKLGKKLIEFILSELKMKFPNEKIRISAQSYLLDFYKDFGFIQVSEEYLEDAIPHCEMVL